jgi:dihydroxyacetone kinase
MAKLINAPAGACACAALASLHCLPPQPHSRSLRADFVSEMLDGLCEAHAGLARLAGGADVNVVVRRGTPDATKVALLSGGGSGHEPAHAGYVGRGMLSAAVCGAVFASPSVAAVLAAIRAVATPAGVLVIVKNYTGDRLNFGLAAERAKAEFGLLVEMCIVGDDCALPPTGIAGRRGLAGVVLIHKVAGAAAAAGLPLAAVAAEARAIAARLGTVGVALSVATLPGCAAPARQLPPGCCELGLGIHGEPGAETAPLASADAVVARLLERIRGSGYAEFPPGCSVALLVRAQRVCVARVQRVGF